MCDKKRKHTTYVPLHGHSTYSLGDGVTKIEDIIKRVKEIGSDAAALTEHGNMSSFFKFYNEANANGIKPILGCELYLNDKYHYNNEEFKEIYKSSIKKSSDLDSESDSSEDEYGSSEAKNNHFLAYATNYDGLKNLIKLSNIGFQNFYRKPLVSSELIFNGLDKNNIITTGCLASQFNEYILTGRKDDLIKTILKYKEKFEDNFYLEVQLNGLNIQNKVNSAYKFISEKYNIKPVFALDYHYAWKEDWYIQYLLYVIKSRNSVESLPIDKWFYSVRDLYIKEIDTIYELAEKNNMDFDFLEKAIDSTFEIRDKVNIKLPKYPDNYPKYTNNTIDSITIFRDKLNVKWNEKIKNNLIPSDKLDIYKERLIHELEVIEKKGIVDYFLILDDLLNNFVYKTGGATGAGRGSAAGSLVLFVLDITKVDPIKYNLIFARFLNHARQDPPDVDLDIDSITQKEVETYLKEKWGDDKVCHIANYGKFGAKTIIKDLCRIFELDYNLSNELTALFDTKKSDVPIEGELIAAKNLASIQNNTKLIKFIDDNKDLFIKIGTRMSGMVRQIGRHASGILISNKLLSESDIPIARLKGDLVTGVQEGGDEREVTELGYLKLDILGLIAATVNSHTMKKIENHYNINDIERKLLISDFDDKLVYKEFEKGNSRDIFQFGSDSMITLIKKIKPNCIQDLCAINALFRPALIESGGVADYLKNRKNYKSAKKKFDSYSEDIWPIVEETYGIMLYQEQIMTILQKIGDFTMDEADKGRKILKLLHKGNQDKSDAFTQLMGKFKQNAINKGIAEKGVDELLHTMAAYTEYSFNKSHSLSYSINAYISMWLKVHYPKEYYSVLINNSTNNEIDLWIKQAKEYGVEFELFDHRYASAEFEVNYSSNKLHFGLNKIKGLKSSDIDNIVSSKINDIYDFTEFLIKNKISKSTVERLCRLDFYSNILNNSKMLESIAEKIRKSKNIDDVKIFVDNFLSDNENMVDFSQSEKYVFQKEYLEFYFVDHPFIQYKNLLKGSEFETQYCYPKNIAEQSSKVVEMLCIVSDIQMKKSKKNGREYYKLILEDDEKQINATVWDSASINNIEKGDFIAITLAKSDFGYSKERKTHITKLN